MCSKFPVSLNSGNEVEKESCNLYPFHLLISCPALNRHKEDFFSFQFANASLLMWNFICCFLIGWYLFLAMFLTGLLPSDYTSLNFQIFYCCYLHIQVSFWKVDCPLCVWKPLGWKGDDKLQKWEVGVPGQVTRQQKREVQESIHSLTKGFVKDIFFF